MAEDHTGTPQRPLHMRDLHPGDFFFLDQGAELRLLIYRDCHKYGYLSHIGRYEVISMETADYFGVSWYRVS